MTTPLDATYARILLPLQPSEADLKLLVEPYQAMIATQFRTILDRTEHSSAYPWLDTRINLVTGKDLPGAPDFASGWVQGRGLESIVGFGRWLENYRGDAEVDRVCEQVRRVAGALLEKLRGARAGNAGHTYFAMELDGRAFESAAGGARRFLTFSAGSPYHFSDLFCAKGMYAAAHYVGDEEALAEARAYCLDVYQAILSGRFASDQPGHSGGTAPGAEEKRSHGPHMIGQGMAALFAELEPGQESAEMGLRLARHLLDHHINVRLRWRNLRDLDVVEYIDEAGKPVVSQGKLISDPGHALELVGLYLKLSAAVVKSGSASAEQLREYAEIDRLMPGVLGRNFTNGFQPYLGGIIRWFDLLERKPVDDSLPWWNLPETIRAALGCLRVTPNSVEKRIALDIIGRCHNAFVEHYVRPDIYLMSVKVRDGQGNVIDVPSAGYPDADPGYHTALSLIDCLGMI